ncbi:MAG: ECF transporter S component [Oscillospiraceae bacterium]|nr:ECF transporter S component [Oscillospiraceae bacterium]
MNQNQKNAAASRGRMGKDQIRKLTLAALLTAVVVVLALLGTVIRFGVFNVNLALVPIVIGAALLGVWYGAWFGLVNAAVILLSGDAAPFMAVSVFGTVVTVIAKGVLAGLCSGLVYRFMEKYNKYAAVVLAALVCPIVNTGIFLIGCRIFFWDTIAQWGAASGTSSTFTYAIVGLVGVNFLIEVAINVILAPAIARILGFSEDKNVSMLIYGAVLALVGLGFLIFSLTLLHRVSAGENPGGVTNPQTRYLVMAIASGLVLAGGSALTALGAVRKKRAPTASDK